MTSNVKSRGWPQIQTARPLLLMTSMGTAGPIQLKETRTSSIAASTPGLDSARTLKAEAATPPVSGPLPEQPMKDEE